LTLIFHQLEAYCKEKGDARIVGIYFANENLSNQTVPAIATQICDKIKGDFNSACIVMVSTISLG